MTTRSSNNQWPHPPQFPQTASTFATTILYKTMSNNTISIKHPTSKGAVPKSKLSIIEPQLWTAVTTTKWDQCTLPFLVESTQLSVTFRTQKGATPTFLPGHCYHQTTTTLKRSSGPQNTIGIAYVRNTTKMTSWSYNNITKQKSRHFQLNNNTKVQPWPCIIAHNKTS